MSSTGPAVPLPAHFGADPQADVHFQPFTNGGRAVRTQVTLTHHLLSLVQEGAKEVIVADRREKVDASKLLLLAATAGIMSEHSLHGRPMRSMLLFLSPAFLLDHCARHGIRPRSTPMALVPLPQDAFTRHFAQSIELLGVQALNANAALRRTKAEEILLHLHATRPDEVAAFLAAALDSRSELPLRTVVAHHQDGNLSVPELAFLCNMSVSTFKRKFQEAYGHAPAGFLRRRRMEKAKALLSVRMRPSEVYLELGYSSLAAFSTEFKKHFGIAPSAVH